MFGFRGWHDGDLASIECDDLEALVSAARKYEAEVEKANRK